MNDQPPNAETPSGKSGNWLFWIALLAPAVIALAATALGKSSKEFRDNGAVMSFLMLNFLIGAVAAIYCGIWLACRFCKPGSGRVLAAVGLILFIGLLNLIVTFAGCAAVVPIT